MTFRFYLQPRWRARGAPRRHQGRAARTQVVLLDGVLARRRGTAGRLREGLISTARIVLLGLSMDVIYQFKVLDRFYPAEALMMAILLAVIPYFIFRWIVERIARWWLRASAAQSA